jgi:threonine dehydratase
VHPFDDQDVIDGQGTLALEILDDLPDVEQVVVPIGGGGLAAGVALRVEGLAPRVALIGVQAEGAAAMVRAWRPAGASASLVRARSPTASASATSASARSRSCARWSTNASRSATTDRGRGRADHREVACRGRARGRGRDRGASRLAWFRARARWCAIVSGGNVDLTLLGA